MSAWVLPDNFADVLPRSARHVEILRRSLLDTARGYGCELVIPPLLEHLDSLLLGTGESLDLLTFKLVDQMSGRTLGLRADTTIQVARVDAHLLNRQGVTRLCYCGPVAHTRPASAGASRELLQFGAEIYGHAGLEADLEVLRLARDCLAATQIPGVSVDLGHACIARSLLGGVLADHDCLLRVHAALAAKDASELAQITRDFPETARQGLQTLIRLYGDASVLDEARQHLPPSRQLGEALDQLAWLAQRLDGLRLTFDLADVRGYSYYSGMRFAVYAPGAAEALLRGGRYDEIGAAFGRNRPAVGFSLDVHELACCAQRQASQSAIRAPWMEDAALHEAVMALRNRGEVVIALPQGQRCEAEEFSVDRELVLRDGRWQVQDLRPPCA